MRGFDRFQVPLSIDGVRVYLPADNRIDYGRFLTPDVAEVQVAKAMPRSSTFPRIKASPIFRGSRFRR